MSILLLCTGKSLSPLEGVYTSREFDQAAAAELSAGIEPYAGRKTDPSGRTVYVAEGALARDTAAQLLTDCEAVTEPLLNEIPLRSFADTDRQYPAAVWKRKAAAQRKAGDARQAESRADARQRADRLIASLEKAGGDCILVTYPLFLAELLDRLRAAGYVVQRTGLLQIQPLERIVASRREEHCGGCGHNCFLSNPGCGVGKEKAMRLQRSQKQL
ncbi:MAG: hypothetical protein IKM82_03515 [Oscillospiraceae bacterium]|nr:hypothetical protein [Oscillospiraceae bacterium]